MENIFYRRELLERCNGNPNSLTVEDVQDLTTKYEQEIIKKAGINLEKANNDIAQMGYEAAQDKNGREDAENRLTHLEKSIISIAKTKATKKSKIIGESIKWLSYILISGLMIAGIIGCVCTGMQA